MDEAINGSELILTPERQELSYDRFDEHPDTVFYWRLPYQFLGNKVSQAGISGGQAKPDKLTSHVSSLI